MIYIRNKLVFNFELCLHNIENVAYMWYNYIYVNEIINRRDNMIEKEKILKIKEEFELGNITEDQMDDETKEAIANMFKEEIQESENNIAEYEKEIEESKKEIEKNKEETKKTKEAITDVMNEIIETRKEIKELDKEIEESEKEIAEKRKELKDVVNNEE